AVRVGVDDGRDRLVRQPLDFVQDWLAPSGVFRVDDDDAARGDEHGGVAAAALEHEQIVFEFLDLDHHRGGRLSRAGRGLLRGGEDERKRSGSEHDGEDASSFHVPDYRANMRTTRTAFGDILRSSGPIALTGERL